MEMQKAGYVTFGGSPKTLPIDPDADDPFYRYKMRQLCVQVIGNGKMIRTAFLNIDDVAKDLKVPSNYIPSFLAQRMGAKAAYDAKKPERERAYISGEYAVVDLSEHLEAFIRDFVLCKKCRLPEYSFLPSKKRIMVKCRSCGYKTDIEKLNLTQKFMKFVKNHPPAETTDMKREDRDEKEEEQRRRSEDHCALQAQAQAQADTDAQGDEILAQAANIAIATSSSATDDWAFDTSAEAVAARAADMVPEKLRALVTDAGSPSSQFAEFMSVDQPAKAAHSELQRILKEFKVSDKKQQTQVAFDGVLGGDLPAIFKNVKKHRALLVSIFKEKYPQQLQLLQALDEAYAEEGSVPEDKKAAFLKALPAAFKHMYDHDIVDEEVFIKWSKLKSAPAPAAELRTAAKAFVEWLETADEEDSDE
eukprot:TRINITY_DN618_c0_g1_i1.p1 TRINITY_DN618_c0_g1~~TRINITY_DN618_c0_g1_i1.p1  ORF type:complete len:419 (-),score=219.85 TRINITY_DN618_c0_g1_i1:205-1461(-)